MSADAPPTPTKGEPFAAITRPYGAFKDIDPTALLEEINRVLRQEDPDFDGQMAELSSDELKTDLGFELLEIPPLESLALIPAAKVIAAGPKAGPSINESYLQMREEFMLAIASTFNKVRHSLSQTRELLKTPPRAVVPLLKNRLSTGYGKLKNISFITMGKLTIVVALLFLCEVILRKTFNGGLFPSPKSEILSSLSQIADKTYEIRPGEEYEEFNSPLRHPEYVVALNKVVVNLKTDSSSRNPMGMFEFYIEAASREAAVEVSDREKEIKDVMSRSIERITYEELVTFEGKTKLKNSLAHDLNAVLTKGRVRRVYFKSIVLKP